MKAKRLLLLAAVPISLLAAVLAWFRWAPRKVPEGQPPMARLSSIDTVRTQFNELSDRFRLIALLSPTCGVCVAGASSLGSFLAGLENAQVATFVVWMPVLATDVAPPTDEKLGLVRDPRARQFWDPDHLVSKELRSVATANRDRLSPEERTTLDQASVIWDVVVLVPPGEKWNTSLPWPVYWGYPVVDALEGLVPKLAQAPLPWLGQ
jgi:hypothetical protein